MPRVRPDEDFTRPTFPHGKPSGASLGCGAPGTPPCPGQPRTCRQAAAHASKLNRVARARGAAPARVDPAPALAHVAQLLAASPVVHRRAILRTAGLADGALHHISKPGARMYRRTADKLLAVTVEDVLAHIDRVQVGEARHVALTLQAAGYPIDWQGRQIGKKGLTAHLFNRGEQVTIGGDLYRRLVALRDQIGHREATVADGIVAEHITRAKTHARDAGYFPPAAYDDEGRLDLRLLPGHPWAEACDRAGRTLDIVRLLLQAATVGEINTRLAVEASDKQVERLRARLGLRYVTDDGVTYQLDPACTPTAATLRTQLEDYVRGADPVLVCLRMGALTVRALPRDHPAVAQWRAEQADLQAPLAA